MKIVQYVNYPAASSCERLRYFHLYQGFRLSLGKRSEIIISWSFLNTFEVKSIFQAAAVAVAKLGNYLTKNQLTYRYSVKYRSTTNGNFYKLIVRTVKWKPLYVINSQCYQLLNVITFQRPIYYRLLDKNCFWSSTKWSH